jgi:hypothetical protein
MRLSISELWDAVLRLEARISRVRGSVDREKGLTVAADRAGELRTWMQRMTGGAPPGRAPPIRDVGEGVRAAHQIFDGKKRKPEPEPATEAPHE